MSITGDYMLILGKDAPPPDSKERQSFDIDSSKALTMFDKSDVTPPSVAG